MPRRGGIQKREVLPDPKFGDQQVTRFINGLMDSGKKSVAESIFYGAMDVLDGKFEDGSIKAFKEALRNAEPRVEVKSRRVGGATYQVPVEVRSNRREALARRWIINAARDRGEKTMRERLAAEILDAANNRGNAIKKREDTHRMAEANKAFSHYNW
jgi:small subunit ribosomal protein S7